MIQLKTFLSTPRQFDVGQGWRVKSAAEDTDTAGSQILYRVDYNCLGRRMGIESVKDFSEIEEAG